MKWFIKLYFLKKFIIFYLWILLIIIYIIKMSLIEIYLSYNHIFMLFNCLSYIGANFTIQSNIYYFLISILINWLICFLISFFIKKTSKRNNNQNGRNRKCIRWANIASWQNKSYNYICNFSSFSFIIYAQNFKI